MEASLTIKAATEEGPSRLEMLTKTSGEPAVFTCGKMSLKLAGDQAVCLRAKGKQVEVHGPSFQAVADAVTVSGPMHSVISLDGHVHLKSQGDEARRARFSGEHLVLGVQEDRVEIRVGLSAEGMPGAN
jgi:hypothetical protein